MRVAMLPGKNAELSIIARPKFRQLASTDIAFDQILDSPIGLGEPARPPG